MRAEMTQTEFEAQWQPIPLEDFPLPACPQGMVLLKAFADSHPESFEFIRPEDFVHFDNEAFKGIGNGKPLPNTASHAQLAMNYDL